MWLGLEYKNIFHYEIHAFHAFSFQCFRHFLQVKRGNRAKTLRGNALVFDLKTYFRLPDPATFARVWVRELTPMRIGSFREKAVSCNI